MKTRTVLGLVAILVATATAYAQESTVPSQPNVAEVRFHDGDVVKMTLLQEAVEVETEFGKLLIPFAKVRKIEFGLHVPSAINNEVSKSVKRLASDVYKERDIASKDLVQAGHFAFPSLQRASKSSDQEVAYRAVDIMKQISERVSPDLLRLPEEDVIYTTKGAISGKITSPTLKAHSPHFGDVSLKLTELRTMQMRIRGGKLELSVDASKHGSALDQWLDAGIMVDTGQRMLITSDGQVDLWPQGPGQYLAAPKGYNAAGKGGQYMAGALIGRIGENGKSFYIGDRYEGGANEEGKLFLQIVPSPWNNASTGNYRVRIDTSQRSK